MRLLPFSQRRRWSLVAATAFSLCLAATWLHIAAVAPESAAAAGESTDQAARPTADPHPLQSALGGNLDYCDEWLSGSDFKSLKQTAEGLLLLSDLLSARQGDSQWGTAAGNLRGAIQQLVKAADAEDADACKAAIAACRKASGALTALAFPEKPAAQIPRPSAGLHAMMVLLDGTHADAKRALLFDEPDSARRSAQVLAELGPLLSAYRGDANWKRLADDFTTVSHQTATNAQADASQLRAGLSEIYNRCQACHERR